MSKAKVWFGILQIVTLPGFAPQPGQSYQVLAASAVNGTFATIDSPFAALPVAIGFATQYHASDVTLAFTQIPYMTFAQTSNQTTVAGAFDAAVEAGRATSLQSVFNTYPDGGSIARGLNELSLRQYARWFDAALFSADALGRTVEAHLTPIIDGASGWSGWAEVVRREAHFNEDTETATATLKTDGLTAGLDYTGPAGVVFGGLLAYEDSVLHHDANSGTTAIRTYQPTLYARYVAGDWNGVALVGGAWHDYTAARTVVLPGYPQIARGETKGREQFVRVHQNYNFLAGEVELTPYTAAQYLHWDTDSFAEHSAGEANLRVGGQSGESLASRLGLRIARPIHVNGLVFVPQLDVARRHEFRTDRRTVAADLAGSPLAVRSARPNEDGWIGTIGIQARLRSNLSLYASYTTERHTAVDRAFDLRTGVNFGF